MILATGVDIIEIHRFAQWRLYSEKQLTKIFSPHEIDYCLSNVPKSAERFAVRFAAREAFYKALCTMHTHCKIPFLLVCKATTIKKNNNIPELVIDWQLLTHHCNEVQLPIKGHCSLSHANSVAIAQVILENIL